MGKNESVEIASDQEEKGNEKGEVSVGLERKKKIDSCLPGWSPAVHLLIWEFGFELQDFLRE